MRKFLNQVGVSNIKDLFTTQGRLYFAANLIWVNLFDKFRGTRFGGRLYQNEIGTSKERANDYSASPRCLIETLKTIQITREDTILDLGCGKGLGMYYMSKFPFKKIGGVELSKVLVEDTKYNLKKICPNDKKRFRVVHADAGKFKGYDSYNFFYIYNSFPREVVKEVIKCIEQSLNRKPRKIVILYLYPEYADEFRKSQFCLIKKGSKKEIREGMHIYINKEYRKETIFK